MGRANDTSSQGTFMGRADNQSNTSSYMVRNNDAQSSGSYMGNTSEVSPMQRVSDDKLKEHAIMQDDFEERDSFFSLRRDSEAKSGIQLEPLEEPEE